MLALKASWQVHAGLIPGTPIPEYTKTWHYTSREYEEDYGKPAEERTHYLRIQKEAQDYCNGLQSSNLNWANLAYVWY